MYTRFYGLQARPFDLTPDPRYLYLTPKHRTALTHLEYALASGKGIAVLVGEVGTGKTILLRTVLSRPRTPPLRCATIWNPTLTRTEFYQLLAREFRLSAAAAASKAEFLIELEATIRQHRRAGVASALVVDEAQALSLELLEEVRLLANIESDTEKLLQVILVGQPELGERLGQAELRQLKQRVAIRCTLAPLDLMETAAYVAGRLRIAGGDPDTIFTRDAVMEVYARSEGIPRLISVICDNALIHGFALDARRIDREIVEDVCRDFDLGASAANQAPFTIGNQAAFAEPPLAPGNAAPEPAVVPEPESDDEEPRTGRRFSIFGLARAGSRS